MCANNVQREKLKYNELSHMGHDSHGMTSKLRHFNFHEYVGLFSQDSLRQACTVTGRAISEPTLNVMETFL